MIFVNWKIKLFYIALNDMVRKFFNFFIFISNYLIDILNELI